MKRFVLAGICSLLMVSHAWADEVKKGVVPLEVRLAADGSVRSAFVLSDVPSEVVDFLEARVRGWTFQPGQVDGEPRETDTTVVVSLEIRDSETAPGSFDMSIVGASTGVESQSRPIFYPRGAQRRAAQGAAVVYVDIDSEGQVVEIRPFEHAPPIHPALEAAAIDAIRSGWKFTPERVAGQGVPATVVEMVCFRVNHRVGLGGSLRRVAEPTCEYSPSGDPADMTTAYSRTLQPVARLLSDPTAVPVDD